MLITSVNKRYPEENNRQTDSGKCVFDICIDNKFTFSIPEEVYFKLNLYEKSEITEKELEVIKKTSDVITARTKALAYLSFKMRTAKEVEYKLAKDGFDPYVISEVIKELKEDGYINDRLYVKRYIKDRMKLKPKSKNMLMFELKNKGIDEGVIEEELKNFEVDNVSLAKDLLLRKFKKADFSDMKIKQKAYSFLKYRGFTHSEIIDAINQITNGHEDEMP
ncbi:MAG TPA: regulatory protein RecX [Clostridiaceae bacterium]|nr:regulatory protein RecX [Clostridiaceae bacterium]